MTLRLCKFCEGWHDLEYWPSNCMPEHNWNRSELSGPYIASDTMQPVKSMLDGKLYDSKSKLRSTYRAAGVTEVGNDPAIKRPFKKPKPDRKAIKASVERAFSRAGFGA